MTARGETGGALRFIPSISWLKAYQRAWLRPDLLAGLSAAAVVLPKALAYAAIAGLPVQVGLYTAFIPPIVYAFLGTSRPLSVSTTTTIAILSATALGGLVPSGDHAQLLVASATLAVLVGAVLMVASFARLGFVPNFISDPVLTGFKSGIGLVIVVDQLPKLLGVHIEKVGFFRNVWRIIEHVPETSLPTLAVAASVLVLIFLMEHFVPRAPVPLIVVALAILATWLLGLEAHGVSTVGTVAGGLPSLTLPRLEWVEELWPSAVGIALMSFTESIAAARAFGTPEEPRPTPNQELLALGAANAAGGLIGAMPAGGGTSQTAVNRKAGAKTQLAEVVTGLTALAALLVLARFIGMMPQAALAAVVVAYSVELIKPAEFRKILKVRRTEFSWALVALVGVAVLGTLKGIVAAVIASLVSLAQQAVAPPVYRLARKRGTNVFRAVTEEHPDDESWPGLLLLRVEGRVFFANAERIGDQIWPMVHEFEPKVVVIDMSAVIDLEYTALRMLDEAEQKAKEDGVELWLAALNPEVLATVRRSPLGERLRDERLFFNLEAAVERFRERTAT
ncbi:MAG: SulP family inorganic anion transporter [Myxococcota bacterium]